VRRVGEQCSPRAQPFLLQASALAEGLAMIVHMCLVSLLPPLLIGVAAAQTASGPTAGEHQLQPSQQQIDGETRGILWLR